MIVQKHIYHKSNMIAFVDQCGNEIVILNLSMYNLCYFLLMYQIYA